MNKKILATAITALLATSAQAANIYDADGMTVDVSGGLEVIYGNTTTTDETTMDIDDADINFSLSYDLGNDLTAIGEIDVDNNAATASVGDTFVGLSHATMGTVTIGNQATILDDAGIADDYEIGIAGGHSQDAAGYQVIKYTFQSGAVYGGVAYMLNSDIGADDDTSAIDGKIGVLVEEFDLTLYAGQQEAGTVDQTDVLFEVKYSEDALSLGGFVGSTTGDVADTLTFGVAAAYQMGKTGIAAGLANQDVDGADAVQSYFANVDYAFTSNVSAYAEVGGDSEDGSDTLYNVGMVVSF